VICSKKHALKAKRDGQPKREKVSRFKLEQIQVNDVSLESLSGGIRAHEHEDRVLWGTLHPLGLSWYPAETHLVALQLQSVPTIEQIKIQKHQIFSSRKHRLIAHFNPFALKPKLEKVAIVNIAVLVRSVFKIPGQVIAPITVTDLQIDKIALHASSSSFMV
jgi:hypothetical protein